MIAISFVFVFCFTEVEESHMTIQTVPEPETFTPRSATADIIAAAVGPSGPNSEYLFNLKDFILSNGLEDGYIQTLARNVALRMGPWRSPVQRRYNREHSVKETIDVAVRPAQAAETASSTSNISGELSKSKSQSDGGLLEALLRSNMVAGWGSNEHQQLGASTVMTHPERTLRATCGPISLQGEGEGDMSPVGVRTGPTSNVRTKRSHSYFPACSSASATDFGSQNGDSIIKLLAGQIQNCQILCGVGYSAFLGPTGVFSLWGEYASEYVSGSAIPISVGIGAGTDTEFIGAVGRGVVLSAAITGPRGTDSDTATTGPESVGPVKEVIKISDVAGAALGYEHMLLLSGSGWVTALGDNYWGQCRGPKSFVRVGSKGLKSRLSRRDSGSSECCYTANISSTADSHSECRDPGPAVKILKVAVGVRHSAAVTVDGSLYVWGTGSAARIAPQVIEDGLSAASDHGESWCPPDAKLIDVSCGLHHTVAVDERGRVWSFGDDKFSSLGRYIPAPLPVPVPAAIPRGADKDPLGGADSLNSASASAPYKFARAERRGGRVERKDSTPRLVEGLERGVRWQRVRQPDSCSLALSLLSSVLSVISPLATAQSRPLLVCTVNSSLMCSSSYFLSMIFALSLQACCGWSHTVLRGVRPDGSIACAAWGRRDLGQYPLEESFGDGSGNDGAAAEKGSLGENSQQELSGVRGAEGSSLEVSTEQCIPQRLSLPHGLFIREVWAGTEFIVVTDEKGYLWACGWNDHGNLGRGGTSAFESSHKWVKVLTTKHRDEGMIKVEPEVVAGAVGDLRSQGTGQGSEVTQGQLVQVRLSTVWEGALACGGGHALCLTYANAGRGL
jgi:Regulator of chromosome condensation (RCC1) repeat/ChaC-like protein